MKRGRPREFDQTQALDKAMVLFWRNGYRGVSLDDLTEAMEITRPSLYGAFGDKERLFLQAVDHYRETVLLPPFKRLLESTDLKSGLMAFFLELTEVMTCGDRPGCFIACMLSQESVESPAIKEKLATLVHGADLGFAKLFTQHKAQLRRGLEPEDAARVLTSVLHGIAIRARTGAAPEELRVIGIAALNALCAD